MKKFIITITLLITLVGSVFAQSIEESNRKENLFSTFYSYVDDLNKHYKTTTEARKDILQIMILQGKTVEEVYKELEKIEEPVQIKIKSAEYSSDVVWNAPEVSYAKKLNNVYEFEFVVSKENLGPALVAFCAGLYGFFDDSNYSDEEEIPGISNEDLRDCYNLLDIAANYFLDDLSNEDCALIRQYCIDTVGLEVYNLILEDLK